MWLLALLACTDDAGDQDSAACPHPLSPPTQGIAPTAPPWVMSQDGDRAVLRFELLDHSEPLPVWIDRGGDCPEAVEPTVYAEEWDYAWPLSGAEELDHPDLQGLRVLQEVSIEELKPGEVVGWTLELSPDESLQGSFRAPPAEGEEFRVLFMGDTMFPNTAALIELATPEAPDLYIHGGDLQYQSNPFDTWSGLMHTIAPITEQALFHPSIGNHEHEDFDEFAAIYTRFFQDAGDSGDDIDYHAFSYGGVRFVALSTESDMSDGSAQLDWLEQELAAHASDTVLVYFHRPTITLGKHEPRMDLRDLTHPLFVEHGVELVLTGHNHSYERFEVDGVAYLTDGGGGAFLYDVDEHLDDYPEDAERRLAADQSFGFTLLDIDAAGIELRRLDGDGVQVDQLSLPR